MNRLFLKNGVRMLFLLGIFASPTRAADRPNVLFIAVDDLRPQINCYGETKMVTPNIDRLAASGTLFERAYCMVPTCGASRASLLTGIRPAPNRFVNYLTKAEVDAPGIKTLNTHFKDHGYYTVSLGKVFHHLSDNQHGWSEPPKRAQGISYHRPENVKLAADRAKKLGKRGRGPAWEAVDAPEEEYSDAALASMATSQLQKLAKREQPFFLAVGFMKPHLPFVCPQKYWELYDPADIQLPETYHRPQDAPDVAIHTFGELRSYAGIPAKGPVDEETARNLIHGYYACVSFTDAQIGKLLDEVSRLGIAENTIIVLWGDHGWNLGEHTLWCKHSCFETSMQIPLIIRVPHLRGGQRTSVLTETIDLYPTLCDLAGLQTPAHLDGESLLRVLHDPDFQRTKPAIGRYQNGDTIRTENFRYTRYGIRNNAAARMLYDHNEDPAEDRNIAEKEELKSVVERLDQILLKEMGKNTDHGLGMKTQK